MIRTNRAGAYNSTTLIDCNTRKYHGQLVMPIPEIDDTNHVLLSSLDETVIQHGAERARARATWEFINTKENTYSPNGHKHIRQFDCEVVSRTVYRVGRGLFFRKSGCCYLSNQECFLNTLCWRRTLLLYLRFKPFLAFRSVNDLTHQNDIADTAYVEVQDGIRMCLYESYPCLHMQFLKKITYVHQPDWHKNIGVF